jgi:hypothetical protein
MTNLLGIGGPIYKHLDPQNCVKPKTETQMMRLFENCVRGLSRRKRTAEVMILR